MTNNQGYNNKFNHEALSERFVVALSSLAGNVGQAVSASLLSSFLGTKQQDINLQEIKTVAEQCGFTIMTNLYVKGLKQLKLKQNEATILLLNTPKGADFIYVYNPPPEQQSRMLFADEVDAGGKKVNNLYFQEQISDNIMGITFFFKQIFGVAGYIVNQIKNGFINLLMLLLFPLIFIKRQLVIFFDFLRYVIKINCINYLKKTNDKKQRGLLYKLFFPLHWIIKEFTKFVLINIGETRQNIISPDMVSPIGFSPLNNKDIELLNKYKYYRVNNGVLCEVKFNAYRLNKIFSSVAITAKKLTRVKKNSYLFTLRGLSKQHWLWSLVQKQKPVYMRLIIATSLVNIFAVIGSLYTMAVYDKVVPNNSIETLWTLSIGMVIMYVFDYILKLSRTILNDKVGSNIDLFVSKSLFNQLISIRLQHLKASTGYISTIMSDFTTVSKFFSSATLLTLVELPFFFIYLYVMAQINFGIMLVLLGVALIVILLGFLTLPMLSTAVKKASVATRQRQGVLLETIGALETIKSTGGTRLMNQRFREVTVATIYSDKQVKFLSRVITYTMRFLQQISSVGVVVLGVYAISAQSMTMGGVIACSILLGRALASVTQFANILTHLNQFRSSIASLDKFMLTPNERQIGNKQLPIKKLKGNIELKNVSFKYDLIQGSKVLKNINLKINSGEKIAILGRIGSGKSTLLKVMFGINIPTSGQVLYDNINCYQISSSDLRARIGYVSQAPVLISGTIMENLTLGNPYASYKEVITICKTLGIDKIVAKQKNGYNQKLREKGVGLSVGQKQLFAVAQILIKKPDIIFMDEPTSSLDDFAVRAVRQALMNLDSEITLVLVAHSQSILTVVDRLVIIEDGKLIADGTKDKIMQYINDGKISLDK